MKRKLIALCVSSVLVGTGIIFNINQDVSVPTVEKFTEDTSASVSKHENVDKDEKSIAASTNRKAETKESKNEESSTEKNESQKASSKQTSTSKSKITASVSSESKKQNSKKEGSSKSSSSSDKESSTSNSSNASSKSNNDLVNQPVEKPNESKSSHIDDFLIRSCTIDDMNISCSFSTTKSDCLIIVFRRNRNS